MILVKLMSEKIEPKKTNKIIDTIKINNNVHMYEYIRTFYFTVDPSHHYDVVIWRHVENYIHVTFFFCLLKFHLSFLLM